MANSEKYNIIVVSGPSGSGKSTLIHRLLKEHKNIVFSVSHTTRPKRDGEIDGKDYYFVTEEDFRKKIAADEFVEWAQVYRNLYGTTLDEVKRKASGDQNLILDVDVQGAANIKKQFPGALFIFIVPPTLAELKKRLIEREKVLDGNIEKRSAAAKEELEQYHLYDYIVINDKVEDAYTVLKSIYTAYNNSAVKKNSFVESILAEKKV